jgi:very-short-patch-repair endonuclease
MTTVRDAAAEHAANRAMRSFVSRHGGVVRTRALVAAGWSRGRVDRALRAAALVRVRSGWVCLPDADPQLVDAARAGVVLSCVTQARRLGLWVLGGEGGLHVAAPAHSGRVGSGFDRVHWSRPVVPRHPDALADPVENVLAMVSTCQPFETALAVWESALNKGLADRQVLGRLDLPTAARRILERAEPYADSGLETLAIPRLRWLRVPLRRQIWIAGHRVDLLIGERLVLQIDGGHHVGAQRESDIAHDAALMLMGYHVIRVGYAQVSITGMTCRT